MELVIKLLTVFGLATVELWAAIPAGLALQLHPLLTAIVAIMGATVGMLVVFSLGERVQTWLLRLHSGKREDRREGHIYSIWIRCGVVGLGLLAPLFVGAPLGTALGIVLGAPAGRLLFWMSVGIILGGTGLTLAGALGLAGIKVLGH